MRDQDPFSPGRQSGLLFPVAALAAAVLLAAPQAAAHVFGEAEAGWNAGFSHPFLGLDHVLAMLAVGLWAAQIGRPALWLLPLAFPLAMAFGGLLSAYGMPLPLVEAGIAASSSDLR
jgi:urease accessory protein